MQIHSIVHRWLCDFRSGGSVFNRRVTDSMFTFISGA
jgi:hypothetical protein